jgi:hypothetical protein
MSGPLLLVAAFAIVTTLLAWARWLAGRRWAAAGHLAMAAIASSLLAVTWPVVRHLSSYEHAVQGDLVAELHFERAGARRYRATLTRLPSGRMQVFDLIGDEWRLDARRLRWSPRARELGLRPLYRLERLVTRKTAPATDDDGEPRASLEFALGDPAGADPWSKPRPGVLWGAAARATKIEGPWQSMVEGERFEVRLLDDGLVVSPHDEGGDRAPRTH